MEDAITIALNTALSHRDNINTYVRMLFIDYSSAFNTIVSSKIITKVRTLGLNPVLCNWVLYFLMGRPQVVKVGNTTSAMLILNTQHPPVLPVHPCVATQVSNSISNFAVDTTVVGLIANNVPGK
jgi:gmma-aminobutyric acid receptor subunit gamma/cGMP-dependent protein kinase 2